MDVIWICLAHALGVNGIVLLLWLFVHDALGDSPLRNIVTNVLAASFVLLFALVGLVGMALRLVA